MNERVLLAHGSGGQMAHDLVADIFVEAFDNPVLSQLDDAAAVEWQGRLAFTTDSYVVNPIFFPGGDIGKLAVCGTVNDLSMVGAEPKYLSCGFIIEEGLPVADLRRVVASMVAAACEAGVQIVTGDTKVVHRGAADKLFINTAGVGRVRERTRISAANARPGDRIVLSGSIGDHGVAVLSQREGLAFSAPVESDCAPLNGLVAAMLAACPDIRCLRDATRGGLAAVLNELAGASGVGMVVEEAVVPVREAVQGACEMLGLDPFHVANEGKLVAVVPGEAAEAVVAAMRGHVYGGDATVIGEVVEGPAGRVTVKTPFGSSRVLDMLVGDLLPRIC